VQNRCKFIYRLIRVLAPFVVSMTAFAAPKVEGEKVRNEKVSVTEMVLAPGESETVPGRVPSVMVYLDSASFEVTLAAGRLETITVQRGEVRFLPAERRVIKNTQSAALHYVRVDFLSAGNQDVWGTTGLAPHYKLLLENRYARVYDIRIPAHTNEPQHTHHDRVVVCLSGANLKHRYPDGREESSTLKTGETAWRRGSTHIGQNLGDTDLWVIAVEPK
jgi:hypothetical protein